MEELRSILVVASRSPSDHALLGKALRLARGCGAKIHLFYCDARSGASLGTEQETAKAEHGWQERFDDDVKYLDALIARCRAPGISITRHACYGQSSSEAILQEVARIEPDLVMKVPAGSHPLRLFNLDSNDWRLARNCPATLMLVHGRVWPHELRFGALVNVSERAIPRLSAAVLHACEYLSLGCCGGPTEVIYCESGHDAEEISDRGSALKRLTDEYHIPPDRVIALRGDPDSELPALVAQKRYDVLALGAPTHRGGLVALAGGLSSKLVDATDSDLLLVRLQEHNSVDAPRTNEREMPGCLTD